ncbi:unnamed protein product [Rhodiola kirilowii]
MTLKCSSRRGLLTVRCTSWETTSNISRLVLGGTLGFTTVENFFANMLLHFNWKLPDGMQPNELDMTESFGATMARKEDLLLVPIPYEGLSMAN